MGTEEAQDLSTDLRNVALGSRFTGDLARQLLEQPSWNGIMSSRGLTNFSPLNVMSTAIMNLIAKNGTSMSNPYAMLKREIEEILSQYIEMNVDCVSQDVIQEYAAELRRRAETATAEYQGFLRRSGRAAAVLQQHHSSSLGLPSPHSAHKPSTLRASNKEQGSGYKGRPLVDEQQIVDIDMYIARLPEAIASLVVKDVCSQCNVTGIKAVRYVTVTLPNGKKAKKYLDGISHPVDRGVERYHSTRSVSPAEAAQLCKRYNQVSIPTNGATQYRYIGIAGKVDTSVGEWEDYWEWWSRQENQGEQRSKKADSETLRPRTGRYGGRIDPYHPPVAEVKFIEAGVFMRTLPEDIRSLLVPDNCETCKVTGFRSVRNLKLVLPDGRKAVKFMEGISHPVDKGVHVFHQIRMVDSEEAQRLAVKYHQNYVPGTGSKQHTIVFADANPVVDVPEGYVDYTRRNSMLSPSQREEQQQEEARQGGDNEQPLSQSGP